MSFTLPKSIAIEDMKGMKVTSIGETEDGNFTIVFEDAYRLIIPKGTKLKWQRRPGN